jgi:hypothetical protein
MMHTTKYHDSEFPEHEIELFTSDNMITRLIITYPYSNITLKLCTDYCNIAKILNPLFSLLRSPKSTYLKWIPSNDAKLMWAECIPKEINVDDILID